VSCAPRMVKATLPVALAVVLSISACTHTQAPAPSPNEQTKATPHSSSSVPPPSSGPPVVLAVHYGIGMGDKHVMPAAFQRVTGGSCLAWYDAASRGGSDIEVHLRIPAAHVASAERSARMIEKYAEITVASSAKFADPPTKMQDPVQAEC
jgi:hypothetical protein